MDTLPGRTQRNGGSPAYRGIAESVRQQIRSGEVAPGERLPAIRELASQLGVNRDTVALAYETLSGEGWVETAVGRGTFVRERVAPASARTRLADPVERLMAFENARPRFGVAADAVALHSLIPDPAFYPIEEFRRAFNRTLAANGPELFGYATPAGHLGLRERLTERCLNAGIEAEPNNVVLCHGASQGIALAIRLFARAGEAVAVEEPTYHNVLATLVGLGVEAIPVAMGEDGPDLGVLERVLERPEVRAFYTIPSFHNPLGSTTALAHRRALLDLASQTATPIIEDGYESDLRYLGKPVPPLAALDQGELVVHLSSFSKSLFPGVRVGSITARGRAVEGLLALKHATDLSDSLPLQAALADFVGEGAYDRHLGRMRKRLLARRNSLLAALSQQMPAGARWTEPEGGYQVWLELPGEFGIDTRDLLADAARAGVLFAPGAQFNVDGRRSSGLRLTIARADEEELRRGVGVLASVVQQRLDADRGERENAGVHL